MRKTKIICTLGPSTDNEKTLRQLMLHGMNVARINMSHQNQKSQLARIHAVKRLREELNIPVALLLDTKGPEIRTGQFEQEKFLLKKGQIFTLTTKDLLGNETKCSISFKNLPSEVQKGAKILIDDGLIELQVKEIKPSEVICTVMNTGEISSNKSINLPGISLSLPFINEKDRKDIQFAVEQNFDFIAASFTRNAEDIILLRSELEKNHCHKIRIIAKIENSDGVKNIDEIIRISDGIMIARGDLGVEIPLEEIPIIQKRLIKKAYHAGKQVITATQMLDSMIKNPRPTRAESTDVANAIYDGTSAIMLSGETAAGKYPIQSLKTMALIAERTERDIDYKKRFLHNDLLENPDVTSAISHATCTTAHDLCATAIITVSKSGRTARMISKYRPSCPIIGGTPDATVQRQMNLSWGVIPVLVQEKDNTDELFEHVVNLVQQQGYVTEGDLVVITAGIPLGISGTTNQLKVQLVGNVLVSGIGITSHFVHGKLCVCSNEEEARFTFQEGDILVIPQTSNAILDLIKKSSGVITENGEINSHAAIVGLTLDKPIIVSAKGATKVLQNGNTVTLDANRGIVLGGVHKTI